MTALLTSEIGHSALGSKEVESKLVTYMGAAQDMDIAIRPPDIQQSGAVFTVEDGPAPAIRFGLLAVKNVGQGAVESILAGRARGPFVSLDDVCARVDTRQANRKVMESLIKAGAFDRFRPVLGPEPDEVRLPGLCRWRAQLLGEVEHALARSTIDRSAVAAGQGSLFNMAEVARSRPPAGSNGHRTDPPCSEHELLAGEKEVMGFYLSGHPLARFRKELASYTTHTLAHLPEGGLVRVAGMIVNTKKTVTKSGHAMVRFKLEDLDGEVECVVFPKTYSPALAKAVAVHEMVVVKGRVETRADDKNVLVEDVTGLRDARARYTKRLTVRLATAGLAEEALQKLKRVCVDHPGPCRVWLELETPAHGVFQLATEHAVAPTDALLHGLESVAGADRVTLQA